MGSLIEVKVMAELPDDAAALRFEQAVRTRVAPFGGIEGWGTRRYWKIPEWFEVCVRLRPGPTHAGPAFDGILSSLGEGWERHGTSGGEQWAVWNHGGGSTFFSPQARWANVECFPRPSVVAFDHYSDFAGEGGVRLVRNTPGSPAAFDVWDGYFDPIMACLHDLCWKRAAIPHLTVLRDWTELAGFRGGRETLLELGDLEGTVHALRQIDPTLLAEHRPSYHGELAEVLADLIYFLEAARQAGATVTLSEEY